MDEVNDQSTDNKDEPNEEVNYELGLQEGNEAHDNHSEACARAVTQNNCPETGKKTNNKRVKWSGLASSEERQSKSPKQSRVIHQEEPNLINCALQACLMQVFTLAPTADSANPCPK